MIEPTTPPDNAGPWKMQDLPAGWDWIPGHGLYERSAGVARLNLVFTWDELENPSEMLDYVKRQKQALTTMVSGVELISADTLAPAGFEEALLIGLVANRGGNTEIWQEQLYLRVGKMVGIVTASGSAEQRQRLRSALNMAFQVASFSG